MKVYVICIMSSGAYKKNIDLTDEDDIQDLISLLEDGTPVVLTEPDIFDDEGIDNDFIEIDPIDVVVT